MSIWILFLLCIIQGLTEFLPVSSSGHLVLIEQVFGISENTMFLNLFLHVATLLAVIIVYRKILLKLLKNPFQKYTLYLFIATLFTVALAFVYELVNIERWISKIYPFGFLVTSILLLLCHLFQRKGSSINLNEMSIKKSVMVGLVQGIAVVPGLSRSGSTISSLVLSGTDEQKASEFSFLLSIPIILGGFTLEVLKLSKSSVMVLDFNIFVYIIAFLLTFLVSLLALKLTIKLLKKQKFIVFSVYTFIMFIVTFILNYVL